MAGKGPKRKATINGVSYNVEDWRILRPGRLLTEEWTDFSGGCGELEQRASNRYYFAPNFDTTNGKARLRPADQLLISAGLTGMHADYPLYGFRAESADGTDWLYLLNGQYTYKIKISDGAVEAATLHNATARMGRPALFKGYWYVPMGDSYNARRLYTIGNAGVGDTWEDMAVKAIAFASGTREGIAQLARAYNTNIVDFAANITTPTPVAGDWNGDDWEIGDPSSNITDLHEWQGEWAVAKIDSLYRHDNQGRAHPIQTFVTRDDIGPNVWQGHMGSVHGAYYYYPHSTGLWRAVGDSIDSVGPEADPLWDNSEDYGGVNPFSRKAHSSLNRWVCTLAIGRWIYATYGYAVAATHSHLFAGYIHDDGKVSWHGPIFTSTGAIGLASTGPTTAYTFQPYLWVVELGAGKVHQWELEADGSLHTGPDLNSKKYRGEDSITATLVMPITNFGDRWATKQLRTIGVLYKELSDDADLDVYYDRDRTGTLTVLGTGQDGSAGGINGLLEEAWTPGTSDTCREVQIAAKIVCGATYDEDNNDPTILGIRVTAATPSVYRIAIPVTPNSLQGGQNVATVLQALRNLVGGKYITIVEPVQGGPGESWSCRVIGYEEEVNPSDSAPGTGYLVYLTVERFDYGS